MVLSFIIPTYKNGKSLIKCVEEIGKIVTSLNLEYEIIVVDNFLTNQYVAKLSVFHDLSLKIFKNPVLGAHNSRRLGLYNSKGDIIVFVDDDNYLTSDYVVFILSTLESKISSNFFIGCATKEFTNVDWKKNNAAPFVFKTTDEVVLITFLVQCSMKFVIEQVQRSLLKTNLVRWVVLALTLLQSLPLMVTP